MRLRAPEPGDTRSGSYPSSRSSGRVFPSSRAAFDHVHSLCGGAPLRPVPHSTVPASSSPLASMVLALKLTCCSRHRWQESPRPTATARGPGLTTARASQPLPAAHRRVRRPPGWLAPPSPERAAAAAPGWPTVGVSESHFVLGCPGMSAPVFKVSYKGEVSDRTPIAQRPAVSGAANARRANKAASARARGRGPGSVRPRAALRCANRWIMDDGLFAAMPP